MGLASKEFILKYSGKREEWGRLLDGYKRDSAYFLIQSANVLSEIGVDWNPGSETWAIANLMLERLYKSGMCMWGLSEEAVVAMCYGMIAHQEDNLDVLDECVVKIANLWCEAVELYQGKMANLPIFCDSVVQLEEHYRGWGVVTLAGIALATSKRRLGRIQGIRLKMRSD